jgi:methylenetetrahydrofolate dehydrogenase (NADP+)/methenyltetrahydrofolate cyclohydrolase
MSETVAAARVALDLAGRPIAGAIKAELAEGVAAFVAEHGYAPILAMALLGDDKPSRAYSRRIAKTCDEVGLRYRPVELADDVDEETLRGALEALNGEREVAGVLVQMPLPPHLPQSVVIDTLSPAKDIDGITPHHAGRLLLGLESLVPNTPAGGLELLRRYDIPLAGRRAVVVGRSNVVGKPMALLLLRENCTVTLAHSRTADLAAVTREADILIVAIGRAGFIGVEHVKPGAVVIDFGINVLPDGQIVGDVDYAAAREVASAITPVPGGTGLVTNALLARNCLIAAQRQRRDEERERERQMRRASQ